MYKKIAMNPDIYVADILAALGQVQRTKGAEEQDTAEGLAKIREQLNTLLSVLALRSNANYDDEKDQTTSSTRPPSSEPSDTETKSTQTSVRSSKSSRGSSVRSLGEAFLPADKAILSTYRWVPRNSDSHLSAFAVWAKGDCVQAIKNDFRQWVESEDRLPGEGASLNCWEAVMVLLVLQEKLKKSDIFSVYSQKAKEQGDDEAACALLGFDDGREKVLGIGELQDHLCVGDVMAFSSQGRRNLGHVVLVLDPDATRSWVASHWHGPKDRLVSITPGQVVLVSKEAVLDQVLRKLAFFLDKKAEIQQKIEGVASGVDSQAVPDTEKVKIQQYSEILRAKAQVFKLECARNEIEVPDLHVFHQALDAFCRQVVSPATLEGLTWAKFRLMQLGLRELRTLLEDIWTSDCLDTDSVHVSTKFRTPVSNKVL